MTRVKTDTNHSCEVVLQLTFMPHPSWHMYNHLGEQKWVSFNHLRMARIEIKAIWRPC
jgi:uracil-DNA glycosylase